MLAAAVAAVGLALAALSPVPAAAEEPLLTVSGKIARPNRGGEAVFTRADLERLGLTTLRTSTAWTEGVREFEGVLLCDVLDAVGADGDVLEAHALNDYYVEIPADDCRKYPVLLAMRQDGRELTPRDRGPLWIVYPRDAFPELKREIINSRWVWQLDRLTVK